MAGKIRSPNYPALSLGDAVGAAGKLWEAEKRTAVELRVAAAALGYGSLSGSARVTIAALRQYGFLAGRGNVQLSNLAVDVLHGSEEQRAAALRKAALNPSLFKQLAQSHLDASATALQSYLITEKQFSEDGARRAAKAFKATLEFAGILLDGSNGDDTGDEPGADSPDESSAQRSRIMSLSVPYAKGNISIQVKVTGEPLQPYHLARVRKYLELAEEDWNLRESEPE